MDPPISLVETPQGGAPVRGIKRLVGEGSAATTRLLRREWLARLVSAAVPCVEDFRAREVVVPISAHRPPPAGGRAFDPSLGPSIRSFTSLML